MLKPLALEVILELLLDMAWQFAAPVRQTAH